MVYVRFEKYEMLMGTGIIPEEQFEKWERKARAEVDARTFNRLRNHPELVSEQVQECICEIAELLYEAEKLSSNSAAPLASYSNDGESASYDLSRSVYTEEGKTRKVRDIIYKYLGTSGLLYAGV
ncbi:MAG: hypothetical protein Q4B26_18930 [Eubacteriales bacterium]|nr:hypothetical protein [Eubacteriales bacterium]